MFLDLTLSAHSVHTASPTSIIIQEMDEIFGKIKTGSLEIAVGFDSAQFFHIKTPYHDEPMRLDYLSMSGVANFPSLNSFTSIVSSLDNQVSSITTWPIDKPEHVVPANLFVNVESVSKYLVRSNQFLTVKPISSDGAILDIVDFDMGNVLRINLPISLGDNALLGRDVGVQKTPAFYNHRSVCYVIERPDKRVLIVDSTGSCILVEGDHAKTLEDLKKWQLVVGVTQTDLKLVREDSGFSIVEADSGNGAGSGKGSGDGSNEGTGDSDPSQGGGALGGSGGSGAAGDSRPGLDGRQSGSIDVSSFQLVCL
jgi:hypothetical protein